MNAVDIKKALNNRHIDDVFVSECTIESNGGRFDGWAMKKSWAHPQCIGYEIKVHRNDFINDNKWVKYLEYCNSFYFVCPPKLISIEETPQDAGLMYTTETGKVYIKKKAPYRKVPEANLAKMYKRILMGRAKIIDEVNFGLPASIRRVQAVENFIEKRDIDRSFGRMLAGRLSAVYHEKFKKIEEENDFLKADLRKLDKIAEMLKQMDISPRDWNAVDRCKVKLDGEDVKEVVNSFDRLKHAIDRFHENNKELIERYRG